ncbi:MAG: hypothetical protein ACXACD_21480, partial [Candidatus Thorarchaeota archaeon]
LPGDPDSDNDDIDEGLEITLGTDPLNPDSDFDLILDGAEYNIYGTSPLSNDTDQDLLGDYDELFVYMTSATSNDTDSDLVSDHDEVMVYFSDPTEADVDQDTLTDYEEIFLYLTDPSVADTDQDSLLDGLEVEVIGSNPLSNDSDFDLLSDGLEYHTYGTDLLHEDTDRDGWTDYEEVAIHGTSPLDADSDQDGIMDSQDFNPRIHWVVPFAGLILVAGIAVVVYRRVRRSYKPEGYVTTSEPASPGLEPGMDVVVEYKIRDGKVVFGVAVRNDSVNPMSNVQVVLGIPDLTDAIQSVAAGTVEPGELSVVEVEFELQPGAAGELVGMVEYDAIDGEHRIVNLKPVKIVA